MARSIPRSLASTYVNEYATRVAQRAGGEFGRLARSYWPRVIPGGLWPAALGFSAGAGTNENTGTSPDHADFAEVGAYGVPAGPWNLTPANSNTSELNTWYALHNDPRVRDMLGRDACMTANCWREDRGGLADQSAIGIVQLADHRTAMHRALDARIVPRIPGGPWDIAVMFWGWSAGVRGASTHINRYANALAEFNERERMLGFGALLGFLYANGHRFGTPLTHDNTAYGWNRTWQKLRAGAILLDDPSQLLGVGMEPATVWAETAAAVAAQNGNIALAGEAPRSPQSDALAWLGGGVAVAGAAVAALSFARRRRRR